MKDWKQIALVIALLFAVLACTGCIDKMVSWLDNPASPGKDKVETGLGIGAVIAAATGNPVVVGAVGILTTLWGFISKRKWKKTALVYNDGVNAAKATMDDDAATALTKAVRLSAEAHKMVSETYAVYKAFEKSGAKDSVIAHIKSMKAEEKDAA